MTDAELDRKLRAMSVELAESSPAAPTYEELHERAGVAVTEIPVVPAARPEDGPRRPGSGRRPWASSAWVSRSAAGPSPWPR